MSLHALPRSEVFTVHYIELSTVDCSCFSDKNDWWVFSYCHPHRPAQAHWNRVKLTHLATKEESLRSRSRWCALSSHANHVEARFNLVASSLKLCSHCSRGHTLCILCIHPRQQTPGHCWYNHRRHKNATISHCNRARIRYSGRLPPETGSPRVRERNSRHTDTSKPDELYLYAGVLTQAGSIKLPHVSTRNTVDDDKIYLIRFAPFCHSKNVDRFRDVLCVTPFFMTSERTLATEPNALLSVWGRGLFLSLVLLQTFNNNTQPIHGSGSHFLPRPGAVLSCASGRGVLLRGFLVV